MLNNLSEAVFVFLAYLLGSLPTSVWWGKAFYGIDVREFGSGNAGATNTIRVLGKRAGFPVLFIDILKGSCAVMLAFMSDFASGSASFVNYQIALGIAAVIGHIFPVFAGFRGGKGVATLLGVALAMEPQVAGLALIIFLIVLMLFKYVSLASMSAGLSFPIILMTMFPGRPVSMVAFSVMVSILLIVTHKKNIQRLLKKQESKVSLFKAKAGLK
ncbi:MAG TPA: glycerol-3-phosphate 1-O-acyltransferase PlsY [Bacteroidia bacterium]|jgi:glycerol-3-phosphate acyltransferase PlsY|nr:glycerol-3-phosphate 1-O-acyltransferase PlsY [Bacteroidia bacterium]